MRPSAGRSTGARGTAAPRRLSSGRRVAHRAVPRATRPGGARGAPHRAAGRPAPAARNARRCAVGPHSSSRAPANRDCAATMPPLEARDRAAPDRSVQGLPAPILRATRALRRTGARCGRRRAMLRTNGSRATGSPCAAGSCGRTVRRRCWHRGPTRDPAAPRRPRAPSAVPRAADATASLCRTAGLPASLRDRVHLTHAAASAVRSRADRPSDERSTAPRQAAAPRRKHRAGLRAPRPRANDHALRRPRPPAPTRERPGRDRACGTRAPTGRPAVADDG